MIRRPPRSPPFPYPTPSRPPVAARLVSPRRRKGCWPTARRRGSRGPRARSTVAQRSEEHTSELQSPCNLVCRLLLEKKKKKSPDLHTDGPAPTATERHDTTA